MRKLIRTEFVSLDDVIEAPGGEPGYAHSGWVGDFFSDELGAYKLEEQLATDTLLLGRRGTKCARRRFASATFASPGPNPASARSRASWWRR